MRLEGSTAVQVLGPIDAAKFRSCVTLFRFVAPTDTVFGEALDKFYAGVPDERSLALLDAAIDVTQLPLTYQENSS